MRGGRVAGGTAALVAEIAATSRAGLVAGVDQPTLLNTGVLPGVTRTNYTAGDEASLPAGTYEDYNFTGIEINLIVSRVYEFHNCMFSQPGEDTARLVDATAVTGSGNAKFYDCSFIPDWSGGAHTDSSSDTGHSIAALGIRGRGFELYRCQFRNCNDAVGIGGGASGASNVIIEQCYMDNFAFWRPDGMGGGRVEGTHNDGIAIDGGTGTVIRGNSIYMFNNPAIGDAQFSQYTASSVVHGLNAGDDPEQWCQGAGVFVRPSLSSTDNTVIDKNWMTGGQVQVNISGSSGTITGTSLTSNRFGNDGIDKGRYTNVWFHTASHTAATAVTGNTQMDGSAYALTLT